MTRFNFSIDFELGWGDLGRVADDAEFRRRALAGTELATEVRDLLAKHAVPSTWGIVGACSCESLDELRDRAPRVYDIARPQLDHLQARVERYSDVLFCPRIVHELAASQWIEVGSHSFMHTRPIDAPVEVLREDVVASVRALKEVGVEKPESFIPPQNYDWPDAAFDGSCIEYVRHTPRVFGVPYYQGGVAAKFARLWNDVVSPSARLSNGGASSARLMFLRIDRGQRLWDTQLRLIRRLLWADNNAALFCFSHPHNLHSRAVLSRLSGLCEVLSEARVERGLTFCKFARQLH